METTQLNKRAHYNVSVSVRVMLVTKYETKETESMVHGYGAVYNFRSLLHACAIDSWAAVHLCSDSSGQVQNRGN